MPESVRRSIVIALVVGCVAGYWYVNPQHIPRYFRNPAPGLPTPKSPVSNFRPPQFQAVNSHETLGRGLERFSSNLSWSSK